MSHDSDLVDRLRAALTAQPVVREVRMFGGLAFMVNEKMVVCALGNGDLLVRCDPERADELLARDGAGPAEMGVGRPMGRSWIAVQEAAVATDEALDFWVGETLAYNPRAVATRGRGPRPKRS